MSDGFRERQAVKTTAVVTAFNYAGMAVSLVTVPLYLRWLGREDYGLMLTALAFMGYLAFSGGGLNWGSMILISNALGREDRAEAAKIFRHNLVLAGAFGALALLIAASVYAAGSAGWRLPMFNDAPAGDALVLIVGVQCAFTLVCDSAYSAFIALQQGYLTGLYQGSARLLGAVGGALAAYVYRDPVPVLAVQSASVVIVGIFATMHLLRRNPWLLVGGSWISRAQTSLQLRVAASNLGLQIGRTIHGTAPTMVISSVAGVAFVPLYTVPTTLLKAIFSVFLSWNASLQPAYGSAWASGNREWVVNMFDRSLRWVTLIGAVAIAGFSVSAPEVISVWTSGALDPGIPMCLSVAAILVVQAFSAAVQFCLTGINQHRKIAAIELLHAATASVGAFVAVRLFGSDGVGLGMVVAYAATGAPLGFRELARQLGDARVIPRAGWLIGVTASAVAGGSVGLLVRRWLSTTGPLTALSNALIAAAIAGIVAIFLFDLLGIQRLKAWTQVLRRRLPASPS